jgi:hypothetical protein
MEPQNVKYESLPNEVGVQLELADGEVLVLAHNLIPSSDSFAIVYKSEITPDLLSEMTEVPVV